MPLPLLLLDIDGVLNPFGAPACPPGFAEHELFRGRSRSGSARGTATGCGSSAPGFPWCGPPPGAKKANRRLAPLLGLDPLPVIPMPPVPFPPEGKLPAVSQYASAQPLAWIDDALTPAAHMWAATRGVPTLLLDADPSVGLTRAHVERCLTWAACLP